MTSAIAPAAGHSFINPPGLYDPRPNGYSHVVVAEAPARLIYLAGQSGENAAGELAEGFDAQVAQAMDNLRLALAAAGATPADVVKLVVLVVDHSEARLAVLGAAIGRFWAAGAAPACTLIPVPRLALDGMLFEIEATAAQPLAWRED